MTQRLSIIVDGRTTEIPVDQVIAAGYTGRDQAHVQEHIKELEDLKVHSFQIIADNPLNRHLGNPPNIFKGRHGIIPR